MSRQINKASVINIMNRRSLVPATMEGKKVRLTIQGNGTLVDVKDKEGNLVLSILEDGTNFQKIIYNTGSNSGLAMSNPRNKEYGALGLAAEKAGDRDEAHKQFSLLLNAMQLSFSVPATSAVNAQLGDRVDIAAKVIKITTDNGSLLTIDPTTIQVLRPEELAATSFSFDDEAEVKTDDEIKTEQELKDALKA